MLLQFKQVKKISIVAFLLLLLPACTGIQLLSTDAYSKELSDKTAKKNLDKFEEGLASAKIYTGYNNIETTKKVKIIRDKVDSLCIDAERYWANESIDFNIIEDALYQEIDKRYKILGFGKTVSSSYYSQRYYNTRWTWEKSYIIGDGSQVIKYRVSSILSDESPGASCYSPYAQPRGGYLATTLYLTSYGKTKGLHRHIETGKQVNIHPDAKSSIRYTRTLQDTRDENRRQREYDAQDPERQRIIAKNLANRARQKAETEKTLRSMKVGSIDTSFYSSASSQKQVTPKKSYHKQSQTSLLTSTSTKKEVKVSYYLKANSGTPTKGVYDCFNPDKVSIYSLEKQYIRECKSKYGNGEGVASQCTSQAGAKANNIWKKRFGHYVGQQCPKISSTNTKAGDIAQ